MPVLGGKIYIGSSLISGGLDPFYGDESDGALNTSGNVTFDNEENGCLVVKQYSSITINSGHTLTTSKPCQGLVLYCTGDVTIDGTISMTKKAGYSNVYPQRVLFTNRKPVTFQNMLLDSSFESASFIVNSQLGWSISIGSAGTFDTTTKKYGTKSLKSPTGTTQGVYRQQITAKVGDKIYIGCWVNTTEYTSGTTLLRLSGTTNQSFGSYTGTTNGWVYKSAILTCDSNISYIEIGKYDVGGSNLVSYFDGITCLNLTSTCGVTSGATVSQIDTIIDSLGGYIESKETITIDNSKYYNSIVESNIRGGRGGNGGSGGSGKTLAVGGSGCKGAIGRVGLGGIGGGGGGGGFEHTTSTYNHNGGSATDADIVGVPNAFGRSFINITVVNNATSYFEEFASYDSMQGRYGCGAAGGGYGTGTIGYWAEGGSGGRAYGAGGGGGGCCKNNNSAGAGVTYVYTFYAYNNGGGCAAYAGGDGDYAGGRVVIIAKGNITIGATGKIECNGGNGGNGGSSSSSSNIISTTTAMPTCGGGGGGSGGGVIELYHKGTYTNNGTLQCNGGSGGGGYGGGAIGSATKSSTSLENHTTVPSYGASQTAQTYPYYGSSGTSGEAGTIYVQSLTI